MDYVCRVELLETYLGGLYFLKKNIYGGPDSLRSIIAPP
jgi:hypothetical protein